MRLSAGDPLERFMEIAHLHSAEIHHGILPRLGMRFLGTLYQVLARAPRTGVWVALDRERVVGFLAGCADVRLTYRWVLGRPTIWIRLATAARAVWLLGVGRLLSPLTYVREQVGRDDADAGARGPACTAELLSIAVRPEARGGGVATELVAVFEDQLRDWSVSDGYRVSTNAADPHSNQFYRTLGFSPKETVRHHDLVLQVYEKRSRAFRN